MTSRTRTRGTGLAVHEAELPLNHPANRLLDTLDVMLSWLSALVDLTAPGGPEADTHRHRVYRNLLRIAKDARELAFDVARGWRSIPTPQAAPDTALDRLKKAGIL